jgi:hypothetical protein
MSNNFRLSWRQSYVQKKIVKKHVTELNPVGEVASARILLTNVRVHAEAFYKSLDLILIRRSEIEMPAVFL